MYLAKKPKMHRAPKHVRKRKLLHELYEHTTDVQAVAISRDGKWCASGCQGGRAWVFTEG